MTSTHAHVAPGPESYDAFTDGGNSGNVIHSATANGGSSNGVFLSRANAANFAPCLTPVWKLG